MRPVEYFNATIRSFLLARKTATVQDLKEILGTASKRTVFRKLKELGCRSSYSHRGSYYTLDEIADFDGIGLWGWDDVWFSVYGTLLSTAATIVDDAKQGYFVEELDQLLHVATKDALRKLVNDGCLARVKVADRFLYGSADSRRLQQQLFSRRELPADTGILEPIHESVLPEQLKAAIVLFFSLLDEKQRRLYAGLEALKTGRGGDARIGRLLGLAQGTVAKGRRELLDRDVDADRVRRVGGGRKTAEKKHQT
jgi:hypothetical protein